MNFNLETMNPGIFSENLFMASWLPDSHLFTPVVFGGNQR